MLKRQNRAYRPVLYLSASPIFSLLACENKEGQIWDSGRERRTSLPPLVPQSRLGLDRWRGTGASAYAIGCAVRPSATRARTREKASGLFIPLGGREVCESDCRHKLCQAFITRNNLRRNFTLSRDSEDDRGVAVSGGRGQSVTEKRSDRSFALCHIAMRCCCCCRASALPSDTPPPPPPQPARKYDVSSDVV